MTVYADGACLGNGRSWAKSSYGIYCPDTNFTQNGCGGYKGKHTNNTAELWAIMKAMDYLLEQKKEDERCVIYSDSDYAIDSITFWQITSKNRHKKKNVEQIEEAKELYSRFRFLYIKWVKGHSGDQGNEMADQLAKAYLLST